METWSMPEPKLMPSADNLRERLDYNPETGELLWKSRIPRMKQRVGAPAGSRNTRHMRVNINGCTYLAHRIIWKWMTGEEPSSDIDHADRDCRNNQWTNLRQATKTQAVWNRKLPRRVDLPCGVMTAPRGKWRARIMINNVRKHLGTFATVAEAAAAYEAAARQLHGEFYPL
jgi:hypothetical protein